MTLDWQILRNDTKTKSNEKKNKLDLPNYKLLYVQRQYQSEKTTYRVGENISKSSI